MTEKILTLGALRYHLIRLWLKALADGVSGAKSISNE